MKTMITFLLLISALSLTQCSLRETTLHQATQLEKDGKTAEAIAMYERHIFEREKVEREEWENPQFYRLIIADLKVSLSDIEGALREIQLAEEAHVDSRHILDRVRKIAIKISEKGDPDRAVELLDHYRHLDEVLVDSTIDRIARQYILLQK